VAVVLEVTQIIQEILEDLAEEALTMDLLALTLSVEQELQGKEIMEDDLLQLVTVCQEGAVALVELEQMA
jgi:intracellular sulfur oxidation DsrE/DsrF family protein